MACVSLRKCGISSVGLCGSVARCCGLLPTVLAAWLLSPPLTGTVGVPVRQETAFLTKCGIKLDGEKWNLYNKSLVAADCEVLAGLLAKTTNLKILW